MKTVTAAILKKNNRILIARRAPGEKLAGYWEFPGGKLEEIESPEQCLERELFEEFGVQAKVNDFFSESIFNYPNDCIRLLAYKVDLISKVIRLTVHDEYKWVRTSDLLNYNLLPADIPIASQLKEEGNQE